MNLTEAPKIEYDNGECSVCGGENTFVRLDGTKTCSECFYAPEPPHEREPDEWEQWWDRRSKQYSGFYGHKRIKMVGGFEHVW